MKKFFIIRADGSSIFEQAYPEDFIFHFLFRLLDSSEERMRLLQVDENYKFCRIFIPFAQTDSTY